MSSLPPLWCDCRTPACPAYKRLEDAWHTNRRLEQLSDRASEEWRKAKDAYDEHLRAIAPRRAA